MKQILWVAFIILINTLNSILLQSIHKESIIKKIYYISDILL